MTDEQLMEAYGEGDEVAFNELFRRNAPRLLSGFRRQLTHAEAEDMVQQTFLNLHRARRDYRPGAAFRPWLASIARNLARDLLRRSHRQLELTLEDDAFETAAGAVSTDVATQLEARQATETVLAAIPAEHRKLLEAHHGGLSFEELARELGCAPGSLRVRAHRAYQKMRAVLENSGAAEVRGF